LRTLEKSKFLLILLLVLSLVAVACGDGDDGDGTTQTTEADGEVPEGGTLVIGAEQEGDCLSITLTCGGASWAAWTITNNVIPRAYAVDGEEGDWGYVPTDILAGEAELETDPQQVVTYPINPDAVWSDGTPITSADFRFTWDHIKNGTDIYDRTGYTVIESVDDSDPKTAVVTFSEPYPDWKGVFGGNYGVLPAHLLEGKDMGAEMGNGFEWSGRPWKLEKWEKGVEAVLVRNDMYWGDKPKLDRVVFRLIADSAAEFQAFSAGEVSVIYPQPQLDVIDQINAGLEGAQSAYSTETAFVEGLWLHNGKPPFDEEEFRKAVIYALDRDAIVERLFGGIGLDVAWQSPTAGMYGDFAQADAFAEYTQDLDMVEELMTGAGWTKGGDGIWERDGERAEFTIKSTTGNQRRELTEQIVQQQLRAAGFDMSIDNQSSSDLFGQQLPQGDFEAALFANGVTVFYPANCNLFCSRNIPTAENEFSGNNWYRVNNPDVDEAYGLVQSTLDEEEAREANKRGDEAVAAAVHFIPLDPLPNILLWKDEVVGPVADNPVMGPFYHMHEWGLEQ
jgi:peptide/nickel transport system substrate-binding protein